MDKAVDTFMSIMAGLKCEDENTLSDTIWAMCMADKGFLQIFFEFMFENKAEKAQTIIREVSAGAYGRNDFVIITDKGKYYVENKINDKNLNLYKYLRNIREENLAYIVNHEDYVDDNVQIENHMFIIKNEGQEHHIPYKKWNEFVDRLKQEGDTYKSIIYYIERITNNINYIYEEKESLRKQYENIYEIFVNNQKEKFIKKGKDNKWKEYKTYGNRYIKIDNRRLWLYIKYTPEFGYMFLFGIENIFQKVINSWKIPFTFRECNPLGYYFHDYYSVFYVDVSYEFEELEKKENEDAKEIIKKIIDKLDRALDEMEQYVGKKGSNR